MKPIFALLYVFALTVSCQNMKKISADAPVTQGITGFVNEIRGNQMPSPDQPASTAGSTGKGLKTTVYIYEMTRIDQVVQMGTSSFYSDIHSKRIGSVETDTAGRFSISLPPGEYSVFVQVNGKYYANSFDSRNYISTVSVSENKVSEMKISVTASATY